MSELPEGWVETRLGKFIKIKHGFAFKGKYITEDSNDNILVTPGNFKIGGGFKDEKLKYYIGEVPEDYILKSGSIIVTMTDLSKTGDTLGYPAIIPKKVGIKYLHNQRIGLVQFEKDGINTEFLYWLLRTRFYQRTIVNSSTGSTVRHTSPGRIQECEVSIPHNKFEQKAIAAVLSAFDNKIELLREQNRTLETLAQTIFKEWFVNFNFPDQNGKAYRDNGGEMVDSELGEIPMGWECKDIETVADRIAMGPFGSNIKVSTFVDEGVPVISGQHLRKIMLTDGETNFITPEHAEKLKNSRVVPGDIIFTHAGNIGQVSIIPENSKYPEYVISQRQFFLRVDKQQASKWFLLMFFKSRMGQHLLLSNSSQVGVPSIARPSTHLKSIKLPFPPKGLQVEFEGVLVSIMDKVHFNDIQMKQLSKTRDTLLPKLMSGAIRVKGFEK